MWVLAISAQLTASYSNPATTMLFQRQICGYIYPRRLWQCHFVASCGCQCHSRRMKTVSAMSVCLWVTMMSLCTLRKSPVVVLLPMEVRQQCATRNHLHIWPRTRSTIWALSAWGQNIWKLENAMFKFFSCKILPFWRKGWKEAQRVYCATPWLFETQVEALKRDVECLAVPLHTLLVTCEHRVRITTCAITSTSTQKLCRKSTKLWTPTPCLFSVHRELPRCRTGNLSKSSVKKLKNFGFVSTTCLEVQVEVQGCFFCRLVLWNLAPSQNQNVRNLRNENRLHMLFVLMFFFQSKSIRKMFETARPESPENGW